MIHLRGDYMISCYTTGKGFHVVVMDHSSKVVRGSYVDAPDASRLLFNFVLAISEHEFTHLTEEEISQMETLTQRRDRPENFHAFSLDLLGEYYEYLEACEMLPSDWHRLLWDLVLEGTDMGEALASIRILDSLR